MGETETLLISHAVHHQKYYPPGELPYTGTGAYLRDQILEHEPNLAVVWSQSEAETRAAAAEATFMATPSITRKLLAEGKRLTWLQATQAGIDHFWKLCDVTPADLEARNIAMTSGAGASSISISEEVLGLMITFSRGLHRSLRQQMRREWAIFTANELHAKTVGIIGLGTIGSRVARLAKAFGTRVIGTKRNLEGYAGAADAVFPTSDYRKVMAEADFLVLTLPTTEETLDIINAETLALMKPTAYLLSIAHGGCINENDLVHALKTGVIAGAAMDNFGSLHEERSPADFERLSPESELWDLDNVIITPDNAAACPQIYDHLADIIVENYRRLKDGRPLHNRAL